MNGQQNGEAGKMIGRALQCSADLGFGIACACKENGRDFAESGANFRADNAKAPKQCRFRFQNGIDCKQNSRELDESGSECKAGAANASKQCKYRLEPGYRPQPLPGAKRAHKARAACI